MPTPYAIIAWTWIVFFGVWFVAAFTAKPTVGRRGVPTRSFLRLVMIFLLYRLIRGERTRPVTTHSAFLAAHPRIAMAGAVLTVIGIAWAIWARFHLGRNWGMPMTRRETPALVTSGPYRFVRHPIYSGALLAMLGSSLGSSLWWLVLLAIAGTYFVYSAKTEERHMRQTFAQEYAGYVRRSKMLIPFVY